MDQFVKGLKRFHRIPEMKVSMFFKHLAAVVAMGWTCMKTFDFIRWHYRGYFVRGYARAALQKRNSRTDSFDTSGIDVDKILSMDVNQLREGLIAGKFTSVQLVTVFAERCQRIGRRLNLSAEENFQEALELAKKRDQEREEARKNGTLDQLPIMHGVPISIKDQYNQIGKLSTAGCQFLCEESDRATEDCVALQLFYKAGAIPIVRGNVP